MRTFMRIGKTMHILMEGSTSRSANVRPWSLAGITVPDVIGLLSLVLTLLSAPPAMPSSVVVKPVPGSVVRAFVPPATPFGAGHRGADLAAGPGEDIRSVLPGFVTFSGLVAGRGWVTVRHSSDLETTYGDLEPRLVTAGDRIEAGQILGRLAPTADHLDWGARLDGVYVDPLSLLGQWEVHLLPDQPDGYRSRDPPSPCMLRSRSCRL
jgi:murein DD-endopeptidase MepM/ murein hydrolase activator NlpD